MTGPADCSRSVGTGRKWECWFVVGLEELEVWVWAKGAGKERGNPGRGAQQTTDVQIKKCNRINDMLLENLITLYQPGKSRMTLRLQGGVEKRHADGSAQCIKARSKILPEKVLWVCRIIISRVFVTR